MKIQKFEDREDWMAARRCKITGSRLKDIVVKRGTEKKIGFYELVAERLGIPADDENAMLRGTRLEEEAIAEFEKETGKKVDTSLYLWMRDDNDNIAISPDGVVEETHEEEAVECKCLGSAKHIEAFLTGKIPKEYEEQKIQYFAVNDKLTTLYWVFYDPRLVAKTFFYFTIKRSDVQEEVEYLLDYQRTTLAEVDAIVNNLTNF